jgi:hypothetical protein
MFHRLSSAQTGRLDVFDRPAAPIPIRLNSPPILLRSSVAIRIRSPELERMRISARQAMGGEFSRQDSQGRQPHVIIQSKVSADNAKPQIFGVFAFIEVSDQDIGCPRVRNSRSDESDPAGTP